LNRKREEGICTVLIYNRLFIFLNVCFQSVFFIFGISTETPVNHLLVFAQLIKVPMTSASL